MKRARITAAVALSVMALAIAPPAPTLAAGDCLQAYVIMYNGTQQTGASQRMCWGLSDFNIEGEPGNVIGPLGGGGYGNDFDAIETQSGIDSFYFHDASGGVNAAVCFYSGKNLTGSLVGFRISTGVMQAISLYTAGSFKFVNGNDC